MQVAEKHHPVRIRPRLWLRRTSGPAVLFLLTVGFFWKLVLTDQYTWMESPDIANQVLPWFQFQAGEWHAGRFPLWDPYHATGQSLIGQGQPGVACPLNWILFSLPLRNGWIRQACLHWYFVLIHYLAALFCYLLCRDLKRSRPASVFAGVVFGLGGYIGTTDWPQMLNGAIWAPLVFLFLVRSLRGIRPTASAALAGMFLGVSWLSGHHQAPLFLTLASCGVWLYALVRRARLRAQIRAAAVFGLFLFLTSALQVLPTWEYGRLARRWAGLEDPIAWDQKVPYSIHQQYSLGARSILGIVLPGVRQNADPYIGVAALSLALLAVATRPRRRMVRLFAALAAAGLLVSLGSASIFHGVLYALVPGVEKARNPSGAIFLFHFGVAVLAAYGIDVMMAGRHAWVRRIAAALAVSGAGLYFLLLTAAVFQKPFPDARFALTALVALLLAGVFLGRWRAGLSRVAASSACVALGLLEIGSVVGFAYPHRSETERTPYLKKMSQHADMVAFLRRNPWPRRVDVDDREIPFNLGDWWGIEQYNGYFASLPEDLWKLELNTPRVQDLLGVGYVIGREPVRKDQVPVFEGAGGLKVFLNPGAFPRVWTIHDVVKADTRDEVVGRLQDPGFDLRRKAFLPGTLPLLETCDGPEPARVLRREGGLLSLEVQMRCRGLVVVSDAWFPGWRATVDGEPARILPAYSALRGVIVEAGRHRVEMRYRPASVVAGALLTVAGIVGTCALALTSRRRKIVREPAV